MRARKMRARGRRAHVLIALVARASGNDPSSDHLSNIKRRSNAAPHLLSVFLRARIWFARFPHRTSYAEQQTSSRTTCTCGLFHGTGK